MEKNCDMKIEIKLPSEIKMETFMLLLMIVSVSLLCIGIFFMGIGFFIKQFV